MVTSIRLEPFQLEDLRVIRDLGAETLGAVVERLGQLKPAPVRPDKLFAAAMEVLAERKDAAESIVRQALVLYGGIRLGGQTIEEILDVLRESIRTKSGWAEQDIETWCKIEPAFGELLSLPIIRLVASAIDLSYEYANLMQGARILTDIRPIFNQDASAIEGAVVSHSLRLRYHSSDGQHELVIAMDVSDIRELAEQCERALHKSKTARDLMKDTAGIPTLISGETDDA